MMHLGLKSAAKASGAILVFHESLRPAIQAAAVLVIGLFDNKWSYAIKSETAANSRNGTFEFKEFWMPI